MDLTQLRYELTEAGDIKKRWQEYTEELYTCTYIYLHMYMCIFQPLFIYKANTAQLFILISSQGMETAELCVCPCVYYYYTYLFYVKTPQILRKEIISDSRDLSVCMCDW